MKAILIVLHCESNTGYAIGALERTFYRMALALTNNDPARIHFGYLSMAKGKPTTLPAGFDQYLLVDTSRDDASHRRDVLGYLQKHGIDTIFGFDQPVSRPLYRHLRGAGIQHFISYWGAPMSSIQSPLKRWLKRIEVGLRSHGPDHYIFESEGMRDTATLGRGIAARRTSVVYLGVDTEIFRPSPSADHHIHQALGIPTHRRIFFFSGHMEPRKGVHVILAAAERLAQQRAEDDWHIALLGNQPGQAEPLLARVSSETAKERITFGGYREDIHLLHRGCYAGIIASTGWDSLTKSSIEMQASGLPLLLSDLRGLREAIDNQATGLLFPVGNADALARAMNDLLDNPQQRDAMAAKARARIERRFTDDMQVRGLVDVVREVCGVEGIADYPALNYTSHE